MSVSGMKKQLHKASQLLNERLMGAEGTKMDDDFLQMEKSVTVLQSLLLELLCRTTEVLQPNPADRAKLSVLNTMSRIRGQGKAGGYPQTESILGDCMTHYGQELGAESEFGGALLEVGGAPAGSSDCSSGSPAGGALLGGQTELHGAAGGAAGHGAEGDPFQLKKLIGRRLDFDYKRRQRGNVSAEEIHLAWEKFITSKESSDGDLLSRLAALVSALLDFHRNAHRILLGLHGDLQARLTAASHKPERRFRPKKIRIRQEQIGSVEVFQRPPDSSGEFTEFTSRPSSPISCYADSGLVLDQPCCRALYSFRPGYHGELSFSAGDLILLTNQVDANWYEGTLGSQSGLFPISYVDVLVPLPLQ
ncbi:Endophilin-A3 [Dissostichus eleginoides]|uniref:Endophilin-A3 n=1 Tax=Dissostichus eleginoides TaxID=100907 RepID=A0AAD9BQ84_DISEL|nr:Endophilin-A3 [Dissostichus eleginoides]